MSNRLETLNSIEPPTRGDWGEINSQDLDAVCAMEHFLGKTYEEAKLLFESNALHYGEDLESMPYAALNYYAPAFAEYITSDNAKGDADGASSFLHRIIWILETSPQSFSVETRARMVAAAVHVANHQTYYDADFDIYDDFRELLQTIRSRIK